MMQGLIAAYKEKTVLPSGGRVPALDGMRFIMVFSVAAFHLWQQSWLTPSISLLGLQFSLDPWLRTGYMWVDGMLLLSGFLLYLPFARAREAGRKTPSFSGFYRRRFLRVFPTYLLNLLAVFFLVALPEGRYASLWEGARDWLAHLSFTHPFFPFSSVHTPLNGALWTLGVEIQFYLIFPLAARAFARMPLATYLGFGAAAFIFRALSIASPDTTMLVNQLPAFLDVYLNGFVAAAVFARLERQTREDGFTRLFYTAVLFGALLGLAALVRGQAALGGAESIRVGQMIRRYPQSVLTALAFIGASLGLGGVKLALGNRTMGWLAAISYQFYMWHQVIALQLKKWRFPPSVSENPHMTGEKSWQITYLLLSLGLSVLVSALVTFFIEQPLAKRGGRLKGQGGRKDD